MVQMWLQDWFLLLPSGSTEHRFPVRRGVETLDGTLTRSALQWERKGWNSGDITRPCGISAVGRLEAIRGELLRCCHLALHPQQSGARLDHVLFQENVGNLTNIGQWLVVLDKHLGKHAALFRADTHDATQQENVVGCVADFLGVQDDLLELASLRKAL